MPITVEIHGDIHVHGTDGTDPLGGGPRRLRIENVGPRLIHGLVGQTRNDVRPARVVEHHSGKPAAGILVRARVVRGAAQIGLTRSSDTTLRTGSDGGVHTRLSFPEAGASVIILEIEEEPGEMVHFATRTDRATDRIDLMAPPVLIAGSRSLPVEALLLDHLGKEVTGAHPELTPAIGDQVRARVPMVEASPGRYHGELDLRVAGQWTLDVTDASTGAVGRRYLQVLPGPPVAIEIGGKLDPRRNEPRSEARVSARLVDTFGNRLDPRRLAATVSGAEIQVRPTAEAAEIVVRRVKPGTARLELKDRESEVATTREIPFSEGSLTGSDVVWMGRRFRTGLVLYPREGSDVRRAELAIAYDVRRARFVGFREDPRAGMRTSSRVADGVVTVEVEFTEGLAVADWPEGLCVGDLTWDCCDEGETCFTVTVSMSPSGPGWTWCPTQKKDNPQCICIEVLYPSTLATGKAKAETIRDQIRDVIGALQNVERCCPVLKVDLYERAFTADEWARVLAQIGADGNTDVSSVAENEGVAGETLGDHRNCIQYFLLSHHGAPFGGRETGGKVTLDPDLVGSRNNVGVHEATHALGLRDRYEFDASGHLTKSDPNDLMSVGPAPGYNHGSNLTKEDCETIWKSIGTYKCS
jgi:hypothetical protein